MALHDLKIFTAIEPPFQKSSSSLWLPKNNNRQLFHSEGFHDVVISRLPELGFRILAQGFATCFYISLLFNSVRRLDTLSILPKNPWSPPLEA